jgi:ubiquinone biosynthesis protein
MSAPAVARSVVRSVQIVAVLCGGCARLAGVLVRARGSTERSAGAAGKIICACLWRLGPAFVKVGQMMSSRRDVLPDRLCDVLEAGLARGRVGNDASAEIEIGSVAVVRRQRFGNVDVALKTIQPDAAERLRVDLDLIGLLARWCAAPMRRSGGPLRAVVHEICESVRRQTDLVAEAATLSRFEELEDVLPVVFPHVLTGYSDADRLVMTWVPGQAGGRRFDNERRVARRLVMTVYEMLFVTGTVHCDLHPGNWWSLPDGRLAIVDAGFSYELDEDMRSHFAEFFLGMASGNAEVCATHALAAAAKPVAPADEAGFRSDMEELIATTTGMTAGDFSLAGFAARFFAIQRRHRAFSRAEFIFPFMALLAIEGQVKQLDPRINFQAMAGPVVLRSIVNRARTGSSRGARPRP